METYPPQIDSEGYGCKIDGCNRVFGGKNMKGAYIVHVGSSHLKAVEFLNADGIEFSRDDHTINAARGSSGSAKRCPSGGVQRRHSESDSPEIRCQDCQEVFPSKEGRNLHTCNSILDKEIPEEGQERITRRQNSLDEDILIKEKTGSPELMAGERSKNR